jgi:hypothetical protein
MQPRHLIVAAVLGTLAAYVLGLAGPFVFDDGPNFGQIQRWLDGQASLRDVLLGTGSGLLHRPVAQATFLLSALPGGLNPIAFKAFNLMLHLGIALVLWQLLRGLLARDARLAPRAEWIAAAAAALWLLHPLHASTVLYAVQRMAQLSALFVLLSLWAYVGARQALEDGRVRQGLLMLWLAVPALMLLGLLSKENAAVAPALCLVVELAWFQRSPRPRSVQAFFALTLLLPALAAAVLLARHPDLLLGAYSNRDFTLVERVLSQGRALVDYIGQLLAPRPWRMGLYSDDFVASTSLLAPLTTALSWVVLFGVSVAAVLWRRRWPFLFGGWFFFLAAHAVESSFLPLELYFEHRNYLPAAGLLLAAVGLVAIGLERALGAARLARPGLAMLGLIMMVLAAATLSQALVWRSKASLGAQGIASHPLSLRANSDYATAALQDGRWDDARAAMVRLDGSHRPGDQLYGRLGLLTIDCIEHRRTDPAGLAHAVAAAPRRLNLPQMQAYTLLARVQADTRCAGIDPGILADAMVATIAATRGQPDGSEPIWRLRMNAATLYGNAERPDDALAQARLAWQREADVGVGAVLVRIAAGQGRLDEANRTLDEMLARTAAGDATSRAQIEALRLQLPPAPPTPPAPAATD